MYDTIIIGSGPAGISASLYLKRANKNILLISKGNGALEKAEKIDNYYGIEKPISGKQLAKIGKEQALNLGVKYENDEVVEITKDDCFLVTTANNKYQARAVILATGTSRNEPNIKGIKEYIGKGVSWCAVCDAPLYKNKNVAVLGSGCYAIHEAMYLKSIANSVIILANGRQLSKNYGKNKVEIESKIIKEFKGDKIIKEVVFEDNSIRKIDGVFIAMGTASSDDLARKVGAVIENNNIKVDENMKTTVEGLYACGDCTGGLLQINKAVYEGAKAAVDIINNNI